MENQSNFDFITQKISELLHIVNELEERFPERKFTLDGHLFGSLGEKIAEYYYGISLSKTGTKTFDGIIDGIEVQIKITQSESVDINDIPQHLLVLFLHKKDGVVYEVYNGPCDWLKNCKRTKNGWYTRSLVSLSKEDKLVSSDKRLKENYYIQKWNPSIRNK
ncbi:MAG: hypothetical protein IKP19_04540 [Oscillospiraceae bacterium]|nr:hypothetical protein [Oscillospiraceae bacterium]